jgi:oxalate decarboxylase
VQKNGCRAASTKGKCDIDLSQWMAGNPADVLVTNFSKPAATFQRFPTRDAFIVGPGS